MAEAYDRSKDPTQNDDSQPSVTTPQQALTQASRNAGVPEDKIGIPAPTDAIDLAYRTAIADVDAQEVGKAVAAKSESGAEPDVQAMGEGTADAGTGPFEGRTVEQLREAARSKGLAVSGTKDELVERLRG